MLPYYQLSKLVSTHDISAQRIYNRAEMLCWFDMAGGIAFCSEGKRDVLQRTTGHERLRLGHMLSYFCCIGKIVHMKSLLPC